MADNVTVDNGDGTDYDVVTDEITSPYTGGTRHAQGVKLLSGTANDNAVIPGDASNGLDVDVTRVQGTVTVGDGGSTLSIDDGGGSITVDGTVAVTEPVSVDDNGGSLTVDNAALSVTGGGAEASALRVTLASDSTGVVSVDDNGSTLSVDDGGSSLTVDGTVTANLAAGTNNIGDVDVASIAAGDNAIGRVKLTDGTDVADVLDLTNSNPIATAIVDGSGTQITSFGGGTQYTEGDTDASVTGTAVMWEDTSDTLRVASAAKPLPVNIISGAGSGGTAIQDDTAFTAGTTNATPIAGMFDNASPDSVDEGDAGVVRMSANRNLFVTLRDAAGNERGLNVDASGNIGVTDAGGSLTVDGTVTTSPSGDHTVVGKAADGAAVSGNPVLIAGQDGTNVQSLKTDSTGSLQVDVESSALPTGAATLAEQQTQTTALQLLDDIVKTDDAAFTAGTDEVSMSGYFADETSTDSVDEGDAGAARMTLDRRQIVVPQPHSTGGCETFHSNDLDETEEDVKTAAGTVYGWIITNRSTATVYVHFYNATAANVTVGTTAPLFIFAVPGNSSDDVAANLLGGIGIKFDTAISVAATTDFPDDGSPGAPAANDVLCTVFYK